MENRDYKSVKRLVQHVEYTSADVNEIALTTDSDQTKGLCLELVVERVERRDLGLKTLAYADALHDLL